MAISGSIAGPDITGIGSAIGAIADEASEVMNEFDRPNWRWVHITKTKNSTSRQEFAFSKFDFVFYAIAGACVYKGIKEHIAGGSFYDFVKQELSNVLNSLRSEIQKMVASAGIGGVAGMFTGVGGTGSWPDLGNRDIPPPPDLTKEETWPDAETLSAEDLKDVVKFLDLAAYIKGDITLKKVCQAIYLWLRVWVYRAMADRATEMKYAYKIVYAGTFLKKYGPSVGIGMPKWDEEVDDYFESLKIR